MLAAGDLVGVGGQVDVSCSLCLLPVGAALNMISPGVGPPFPARYPSIPFPNSPFPPPSSFLYPFLFYLCLAYLPYSLSLLSLSLTLFNLLSLP